RRQRAAPGPRAEGALFVVARRRRQARWYRDWGSHVCSSALGSPTSDAQAGCALARAAARIRDPLYECEPPTGYADRAEAWVNPGALLARMNFGLALAHQRVPGVRVDLAALTGGADRSRPATVLEPLLAAVLHGNV